MAFADWEGDNNDTTASLNIATPIVGNGSLLMSSTLSTSNNDPAATRNLNNTFTRGFSKGRIRTLARFDFVKQFWNAAAVGIYCLATTSIASGGAGTNTYYFGCTSYNTNDPNSPNATHYIFKQSSDGNLGDLLPADAIADTQSLSGGVVQGNILPIQFEWNVDIPNFGGTRLVYSVGNIGDTDFTNLATVYDIVDNSSPITSGSREGIGWFVNNGTFGVAVGEGVNYDQTSVFELV